MPEHLFLLPEYLSKLQEFLADLAQGIHSDSRTRQQRDKGGSVFPLFLWSFPMVSVVRTSIFTLLGLAVAFLAVPTSVSHAQTSLKAKASFTGVKAVAKYEEKGARRKFNFQIELATPGTTGVVTALGANGATAFMGTFTVNAAGVGIIDIDTTEGDAVADLNLGAPVTLSYKGQNYTARLASR